MATGPEATMLQPMSPTAHSLVEKMAETDLVRSWRLEELVRAGYGLEDAIVLSDRGDVDLHAAARLLGNGCPADTAFRILL